VEEGRGLCRDRDRGAAVDAGNDDKPAFRLPIADAAWVWLLLLGNLVPLFVWRYVEGWTSASLALYAGR